MATTTQTTATSNSTTSSAAIAPSRTTGPESLAVIVPTSILTEIDAVTKAAQSKGLGECSWLGAGHFDEEIGEAVISRIFWPKQTNTGSSTDMDELSVAEVTGELDHATDEKIIWWGHSHGSMSTFYSGTDWDTWEIFTDEGIPFFFGSCHNAKADSPYQVVHFRNFDFPDVDILESDAEEPGEKVAEALKQMAKPKITYAAKKTTTATSYGTSYGYGYTTETDKWDLEQDIASYVGEGTTRSDKETRVREIIDMAKIERAAIANDIYQTTLGDYTDGY